MADTVQTAVYRLGLDDKQYQDSAKRVAAANAILVDDFNKIEARSDKAAAATRRFAKDLIAHEQAVKATGASSERAAANLQRLTANYDREIAIAGKVAAGNRAVGASIQNIGFQVGDLATQIASGQGFLRPLIQQGTQLVSMFGPWGAIVGAAGAAIGALAVSFSEAGTEAAESAPKLETWAEKLERINKATEDLREKGPMTAAALAAQSANVIEIQKSLIAQAEAQLTSIRGQNAGLGTGYDALAVGVPTDAVEQRIRTLKNQLLDLRVAAGEFDDLDGRAKMGQRLGTPYDYGAALKQDNRDQAAADREAAKARAELAKANQDYQASLLALQDKLDPVGAAYRSLEKDLITLDLAQERGALSTTEYEKAVTALYGTYEAKLDPASAALKKLTDAQDVQQKTLQAEAAAMGMSDEARAGYLAGIEAENKLKTEGIPLSDARAQAYIAEAKAMATAKSQYDTQIAAAKKVEQTFTGILDTSVDRIGGALTEAFATGRIEMAKFGDVGRAVLSELAQAALQLALINPVKNWLGGMGGGGGGLLPTLLSAGSGLLGLFGGGAPTGVNGIGIPFGHADGGPVAANKLIMVGERGPELFVPSSAGAIMPNHRLASMGSEEDLGVRIGGAIDRGGVTINVGSVSTTVTLQGSPGTPEQNADLVAKMGDAVKTQVLAAVDARIQFQQRGGGLFRPNVV